MSRSKFTGSLSKYSVNGYRNNFTPLNRITDFIKICFFNITLFTINVVLIRLRIIIELSDRLSFFFLSVGIFVCLSVSLIVIFFHRPGCRIFVCRFFLTCLLLRSLFILVFIDLFCHWFFFATTFD